MNKSRRVWHWGWLLGVFLTSTSWGQSTRESATYRRIKTSLDAAAINVRKSKMAPIMKDQPRKKESPKGKGRRADADRR